MLIRDGKITPLGWYGQEEASPGCDLEMGLTEDGEVWMAMRLDAWRRFFTCGDEEEDDPWR